MRKRRGRPVHGILLLDKQTGASSNHELQRAKRLFAARKAGHTGSLDPLATGMLPICFGEATKISGALLGADKAYETTLKLGITTDSADADGQVILNRPVPDDLTSAVFEQLCHRFIGSIQQTPPMVSAIKIDGQRLYKLARRGEVVDRPARTVTIHQLQVLSFSQDTARLRVLCSKGTYIRSLVTDIGDAIGCGAHVTQLRRLYVAPFEQHAMITLTALEKMTHAEPTAQTSNVALTQASLDALLLPIDSALQHLPAVHLHSPDERHFLNGQSALGSLQSAPVTKTAQQCRVYSSNGSLLGLGALRDDAAAHRPDSGAPSGNGQVVQVFPQRVFQWN